jgi:6,7-dimethyl-8-ribityllumazine synthase
MYPSFDRLRCKSYWEQAKRKTSQPLYCIGMLCVEYPTFCYVCKAVTDGVVQLLLLPVPLYLEAWVDNQQQADERIGGKHGQRGEPLLPR